MKRNLIATATFGLEAVVARELKALGYEARGTRPGWLAFGGDDSAIVRANLWLRSSDRVLLEIGTFEARDFGALFDLTFELPWEEYLPKDANMPVRGRSVKSQLSSVPACQRIVKKAIVERLRKGHGAQSLSEEGPSYPIEVAFLKDEVTLAIDTTGPGLHKRGYRPTTGPAPLKETLAAGLVLLSYWNRERPFLDPFCGTGTLAIEAALIGRDRAPGLDRHFTSESWPTLSRDVWTRARDEAAERERPPVASILASDIDETSLALARENANRAGVRDSIRFERRAFDDIGSDERFGCLIANPPYGDRLGDAGAVRELYRSMPDVFRRFSSWSHYVLTSVPNFETLVGQRADRRRKLYNGRIECTYYQFHGPRPGTESARPAFGGLDRKADRQAELLANRLKKRAHHFRKWPKKRSIEAYRIYDRDIKEIPITVDRYGDTILVRPTRHTLTSRTKAEHADWLDRMTGVVADALGVSSDDVVLEGRPVETRRIEVQEGEFRFEVEISREGDTGLALDGRLLRTRLRELAAKRHFLSLNSVSGASAVAAALGGAASLTSVGPSESLRSRAKRNFDLNGIDMPHRTVQEDVNVFLETDDKRYELAVVEGLEVPDKLAARIADGGVVFVVGGDRQKFDPSVWDAVDVTDRMLPEDFRSRKRSRCWELRRRSPRVVEWSS